MEDDTVAKNSGGGSWTTKEGKVQGSLEDYMDKNIDGWRYGAVSLGTYDNNTNLRGLRFEDHYPEYSVSDTCMKNVTVVWVSEEDKIKKTKHIIIGWWLNATVYREFKVFEDNQYYIKHNVKVLSKECASVPHGKREFIVKRASKLKGIIGMGQSNIWYAKEEREQHFVNEVKQYIIEKHNDYANIDYKS